MTLNLLQKVQLIKPLNIVLFGPPGVGKGTYCKLLARDLQITAFSTGDVFRKAIATKNANGHFNKEEMLQINQLVNEGGLVEDSIV